MSYRVVIQPGALKELARLPKQDRQRVTSRIDALASNPRPSGCTKLAGPMNLLRIRVGDYRVIYAVEDILRIVGVMRIRHRRDVYRGL